MIDFARRRKTCEFTTPNNHRVHAEARLVSFYEWILNSRAPVTRAVTRLEPLLAGD